MQSEQVNTGGLLVVRVEVGSSLVHSKPEGEWIEGGERGRAAGYRAGSRCWQRGEKGEALTSGGVRKGGGVSKRTLIRPLGHTR